MRRRSGRAARSACPSAGRCFTTTRRLERSGQWAARRTGFEACAGAETRAAAGLNYLGYSWIDRGENLDEGLKMIEKAVELRPD